MKLIKVDLSEQPDVCSVGMSPALPSSLGVAVGLSCSLSELGPLDLRWCEEGEEGAGEALGVGGKVVMFSLGEFESTAAVSSPLVFSSDVFPFCHWDDLFFLAPFLAFLNNTDVRRPTPTSGRAGGEPSGVTS